MYEPPPTADSHYELNRTERHKNETKKPGNNRQKWGGGVGKMAAKRRVVNINVRERAAGVVVPGDQRPRIRSLVGVEEVLVNMLNIIL